MKPVPCAHRFGLVVTPVCYQWPDGTALSPRVRRATCSSCQKSWAIDLTPQQRSRLVRMRPPGDKRSPYELGPELLREATP